jgi:hypothetical protein
MDIELSSELNLISRRRRLIRLHPLLRLSDNRATRLLLAKVGILPADTPAELAFAYPGHVISDRVGCGRPCRHRVEIAERSGHADHFYEQVRIRGHGS